MGRKRLARALDVYIGSSKVGRYVRAPDGASSFRYDPDWLVSERSFPISVAMPLSDRIWSGDEANSYFDGLLPDAQSVRDKIAAREQAESAGVFDLLSVIGRDCMGALRFVREGEDPGDPAKMVYRPVSDEEIATRLAALANNPLGMTAEEDDFRISLAGMQEKTAFLRVDDRWQLPLGPTPTSHIFKPVMKEGPNGADFSDTPWNEWFCLQLCRALGLETTKADVMHFDGKPVIVVERFDRSWREDVLYRLPQEDLCQALGTPSHRKYESDGGPGILDVMAFLNGAVDPFKDRLAFMKAQIVFWLLAAIDGHAKNFSIFISPGGYRLTPLYDVMSISPYSQLPLQKSKMAISIGDKRYYRMNQIQVRHFFQTGKKAGLAKQDMDSLFSDLMSRIDLVIEEVVAIAARTEMPERTFMAVIEGIRSRMAMVQ